MLALLAATVVAAAPPAAPAKMQVITGKKAEAMAGIICKPTGMIHTGGAPALLYREQDQVEFRLLSDLPKANHEKAVARTVGGCANPLVVQYEAGR